MADFRLSVTLTVIVLIAEMLANIEVCDYDHTDYPSYAAANQVNGWQ